MSLENLRVELLGIAVSSHCQSCHEAKSEIEALLQRNAVIHSVLPVLTTSDAALNSKVTNMRTVCDACWKNGRSGNLTTGK